MLEPLNRNKTTILSAESCLPKPNEYDNPFVNIRRIWAIRSTLGFSTLNEEQTDKISQEGYDTYFIECMNELSNIGIDSFHALCAIGKVSLTMEYVIFHCFYENLKKESRLKIAKLLVNVYDRELAYPSQESPTYHLFS